jgi:hypothetical protein
LRTGRPVAATEVEVAGIGACLRMHRTEPNVVQTARVPARRSPVNCARHRLPRVKRWSL